MNNLPHFICLGAHKSGTSWLYNCLYEHPEIDIREKLDFFYVDKKYEKGLKWYTDNFASISSKKKVGDLSTVYFFSEDCADRIKEFNAQMKLVVVLRNPIDRAYSHYIQDIRMGHISKKTDFKTALFEIPQLKLWGAYKMHMETYLKLFRREQIKIVLFDDIKSNPQEIIKDLFHFLDVDAKFIPKLLKTKINPARIPKSTSIDAQLRRASKLLRYSKPGEKLWWLIKHSWILKKYYRINSKNDQPLKLEDLKIRKELFNYFYEDIKYVEKLTQRKSLDWK